MPKLPPISGYSPGVVGFVPNVMAVCWASVSPLVIISRSPLPPGVVRSKLSVVKFDAVTRLPMVNGPIEPIPPGAISEATEPIRTTPEIEPPPVPLARVPPLSVTFPLPVAEP